MKTDDEDYLETRVKQELEMAQQADHPAVVRAHYRLAELYLDKIHGTAEQMSGPNENIAGEKS